MTRNLVRTLRFAMLVALAVPLAGCFSRTGDLGRRESGPLRETVLPLFGKANARSRAEPVSYYNLTDRENLLRRRATYLQSPPHARDWLGRAVTELETTRFVAGFGRAHAADRYYGFLRSDRFRSSQSRYERLKYDITSDAELVMPFYAVARLVRQDDRERIRATRRRPDLTPEELSNSEGRVHENGLIIAQVTDALHYRLAAYRYAIDRIEIETPSDEIWNANRAWRLLAGTIAAGESTLEPEVRSGSPISARRRSRVYTGPFDEGPVPQK